MVLAFAMEYKMSTEPTKLTSEWMGERE